MGRKKLLAQGKGLYPYGLVVPDHDAGVVRKARRRETNVGHPIRKPRARKMSVAPLVSGSDVTVVSGGQISFGNWLRVDHTGRVVATKRRCKSTIGMALSGSLDRNWLVYMRVL